MIFLEIFDQSCFYPVRDRHGLYGLISQLELFPRIGLLDLDLDKVNAIKHSAGTYIK